MRFCNIMSNIWLKMSLFILAAKFGCHHQSTCPSVTERGEQDNL